MRIRPRAARASSATAIAGLALTLALTTTLAAAAEPDIGALLTVFHHKWKNFSEGKNADYIPALAKVPSDLFGVALVTVDGKMFGTGDVSQPFSIQSISKVFTLAEVLKEHGGKAVEDTIGVDATGQVFNSIVAVEQYKGQEMNPFVNAGAIATTAMVQGATPEEIWGKIIGIHSDFAGHPLQVNQEVYKSESESNERNQATALLMHAYGRIKENPAQATDLYTRQCSINVTTNDLAIMAATLANGGRNPVTKKDVVSPKVAEQVLAVMATAGLYDDSGKWLFRTGLPGKSGVGGGIIAVAPGKFGIAAFSPRLDAAGNSARAQRVIQEISDALDANPYDVKPQ